MFQIKCNANLKQEKEYIINVLFLEFLGIDYALLFEEECSDFEISFGSGCKIIISAGFLDHSLDEYLSVTNIPQITFAENQFTEEDNIPVFYGNDSLVAEESQILCGIDIFDACFFMLSRMEEVIVDKRDEHNRFSAVSSISFQNNFLDRPIVDEYVEMLWNMITHLDDNIERKIRKPSNFITCDVDWPFDITKESLFLTCRKSIGDLIHRKSITQCYRTLGNYLFHTFKLNNRDYLVENIRWMMDINEQAGNKISFYFITEYTSSNDIKVDFDSKSMRDLFKDIYNRGHEIGLHPGYNCYDNSPNFKKSADTLKRIFQEEKILQNRLGGRMHFLRWDNLKTPQLWNKNGFSYDTTLCYADAAGFRCGTCHEFTMFDLNSRKPLVLKQRPLITMESSIIGSKYENLGYSEASLNRFKYFKNICHKYNGEYVLLWHNSSFEHSKDKEFYREIIQ